MMSSCSYQKFTCILMFVVCVVVVSFESNGVEGAPQAPALFVFGDSSVDVGNSNFLNSRARSNYYPYGVDYSGGASGRSTNGKTFTDLLGTLSITYQTSFYICLVLTKF